MFICAYCKGVILIQISECFNHFSDSKAVFLSIIKFNILRVNVKDTDNLILEILVHTEFIIILEV